MKLSRFALASAEEIHDAMKSFDGEIKGVILDLRGNSGGFLPTAIDIADEFLEKDDLIVYTEGRRIPRRRNMPAATVCTVTGRWW